MSSYLSDTESNFFSLVFILQWRQREQTKNMWTCFLFDFCNFRHLIFVAIAHFVENHFVENHFVENHFVKNHLVENYFVENHFNENQKDDKKMSASVGVWGCDGTIA